MLVQKINKQLKFYNLMFSVYTKICDLVKSEQLFMKLIIKTKLKFSNNKHLKKF